MLLESTVPVPDGPVAYRFRLRRRGPYAALALPVLLAGAGAVLLNWGGSAVRGFGGFLLTTLAAPTLLLLGVPVTGGAARYAIAAGTSLALWLAVGAWAAARATRVPAASWRDWWREYLWLAVPIWLGAALAFGVAYVLVL